MAKEKGRRKSKAAQVTAATRAERRRERWEDAIERMEHPDTAGFEGRGEAPAPRAPIDPATKRRRAWIGGIVTIAAAVAAALVALWAATSRG